MGLKETNLNGLSFQEVFIVMTALRSNVIHQEVGQDQMDLKDKKCSVNSGLFGVGLGEQFFKIQFCQPGSLARVFPVLLQALNLSMVCPPRGQLHLHRYYNEICH